MANKRKITAASLWMIAGLQLAAHVKKRILEVLDDLF